MADFEKARRLLKEFKGDSYTYGPGVINKAGEIASKSGKKAALIRDTFTAGEPFVEKIRQSFTRSGVELKCQINGAAPNCPLEDLARITEELTKAGPDVIISFGGGSTIDATKAAEVLRTLGGNIEDYFGTGLVTKAIEASGKSLTTHVAVQTASSSSAHLTKYSNITNVKTGQKKLIVDEAIVPAYPLFDHEVTYSAPISLTIDGAVDGISHCLEVLYGAVDKDVYEKIEQVCCTGIEMIVNHLPAVVEDSANEEARQALCFGTDLGGYAIMLGGTNGGHLTSFSLVDVLSHGRACGMMNPYYTVLFAPAIERPLKKLGRIYKKADFTSVDIESLSGRELGIAVAEAMLAFSEKISMPTTLSQVKGFTQAHIERALAAAKNPQLKMKLQNMPVPLTSEMVDEYMKPVLDAATTGNLSIIKNV